MRGDTGIRPLPQISLLFSRPQCLDPTSQTWLLDLLSLSGGLGRQPLLVQPSPITAAQWWPHEVKLEPPPFLLQWLIENL